ncbi:MAG: LytTR family transcriptional regulator [Flavobacteriaceae bacterium]|nr:LytTR family transcriptional regulator [Flavobacteriaceae bacterium]
MKTPQNPTTRPTHIAVNSNKEIKILDGKKIIYLESSGRFTIIHKENLSVTLCKNLGHYCKLFKNLDLLRIYNSFLINIGYLSTIKKYAGNQYCILSENTIIPISNRKFSEVKEYIYY